MSKPLHKPLQALPTYLGGKRRLLPWIAQVLNQAAPQAIWPKLTFIDLFLGGGAVSFWAKAQGFREIRVNDISQRSQILAEAFLCNQRISISRADALGLTQALPAGAGWIEQVYCPSVFSTRHAQALDQGFYWAGQHPNATKRALLLTLLWHLCNDFVAFPTTLGTSNRPMAEALDGMRNWDAINPKRFTDGSLKRLCEPAWAQLDAKRQLINGGILGGSPVQAFQEDALTLLPRLNGDILYLDPPYAGTVSYEKGNQVLDQLLAGGIAPEPVTVSPFSKGLDTLDQLLSQAGHIPVWLLSYGNKHCSLAELEARVQEYAEGRVVKGYARRYRHLSHVSRNENNEELLVLAYPKEGL